MFVNAKGGFLSSDRNFDLSDSHRSGRPTTLDNDVIKGANGRKSMSDNRGTVKCSYNQPWSTIQEHLQQICSMPKLGRWRSVVSPSIGNFPELIRTVTCMVLKAKANDSPLPR
ncbi:hypothetical protein TNCV_934601 [Trichonephila clavipes]|nr:hypothetical protein TNCV_934601 [Trichonephila clavipes]